ncbi:MAG: hypothetical protein V3S15_01280 [Woeseiaceae bacterium]
MTDLRPKLHLRLRLLGVMLIAASAAVGGEVAVGPADNGVDMPGNKTADFASRSEEISAGIETDQAAPDARRDTVAKRQDAMSDDYVDGMSEQAASHVIVRCRAVSHTLLLPPARRG